MKFLIKQWYLSLIILIFFVISLSVLPRLIEDNLEESLKLEDLRGSFIKSWQEDGYSSLSIQGIHLDLLRGIVLKGFHLKNKKHLFEFYAEDLVIHLSLLPLLSGKFEYKSLSADGAKLEIAFFTDSYIREVNKTIWRLHHTSNLKNTDLDVNLSNLRVIPLKNQDEKDIAPFFVELSLFSKKLAKKLPKEADFYYDEIDIKIHSTYKTDKDTSNDWFIRFKQNDKIGFKVLLSEVPVNVLNPFFRYYHWKDGLAFLENKTSLKSGYLSGEGSTVIDKSGERFDLVLDYKHLKLQIDTGISLPLSFDDSEGKIRLNFYQKKEGITRERSEQDIVDINKSHPKKSDKNSQKSFEFGTKYSAFNFRMEQDGLILNFKNTDFEKDLFSKEIVRVSNNVQYKLEAKVGLISQTDTISIGTSKGELNVNLFLVKKDEYFYPEGKFSLSNVSIPFLNKNSILQGIQSDINIKEMAFQKKSNASKTSLSSSIYWQKSNIELKGEAELRFQIHNNGLRWESNWDLQAVLEKLPLSYLMKQIKEGYSAMQEQGKVLHIRKNLEVAKNEFIKNNLYLNILAGLKLKAKLTLSKVQATYPFPKNLFFSVTANANHLRVELEKSAETRQENFSADFRYAMYFQGSLPKHDIDTKISIKKNENPFSFITSSQDPPEELFLEYRFDGYGVLAGDILRRSYSYLKIETSKLILADKEVMRAISYSGDSKVDSLYLDKYSLRKTTSGIEVNISFLGFAPNFRVKGSGAYNMALGGELQCSVIRNASPRKNSKIRILASGKWVPKI